MKASSWISFKSLTKKLTLWKSKVSRKRQKFNLDDELGEDGGQFMGFTHKGKALEEFDDFNE